MVSAADALERLRDGNRRFVAGTGRRDPHPSPSLEGGGAKEQRPFAIVLACSDSRVPVELVFDQGFGDLFVVRVAGNIAAPSQVGSIEFAAENFGTRLVVVMGHTGCGAVKATLGEIDQPSGDLSAGLRAIVDRIRPAVEGLTGSGVEPDASDIVARAVRANVAASADQLRRESPALERLLRSDGLRIVGAEYALETGVVEFLPESD